MPRMKRPAGPQKLSVRVLLACALIGAISVTELRAAGVTARAAMASLPSVPCTNDDRRPLWSGELRAGARKELVPAGAVKLTICGYNGANATAVTPQCGLIDAGGTFDRRVINRIATQLDRLKPAHGVYHCAAEVGGKDVLTFEYSSGPAVVLTLDTGGCGTVDNGHVLRMASNTPLTRELTALSPSALGIHWPAVTGRLRLCGGPHPNRCRVANFDSADRVVVTNAYGQWVAMAPVNHGRFGFKVATPGSYTFALFAGTRVVKQLQRQVATGKTSIVFP